MMTTFWSNPRKTLLRRWIFYVHFYAGLTTGLIFSIVGITGSIVVFRPWLQKKDIPISTKLEPFGRMLPLESLMAKVKQVRPNDTVINITIRTDPAEAFIFQSQDISGHLIQTYIDQYRGTILYIKNQKQSLIEWIFDLHANLLGGTAGRTINAWIAIVAEIFSVAGLLLWWRGRKYWRMGFEYRPHASWKRQTWDLHSIGGFLFFLPLLLLAVSGIYYSYVNGYTAIAVAITGKIPNGWPAPPASSYPAKWQPLDSILENSDTQLPDCQAAHIEFPTGNTSMTIRFICPIRPLGIMEPHNFGLTYLYVDPPTAQVLAVDRFDRSGVGVMSVRMMQSIHFGEFGGIYTRGLWVIVGFAPGALFFTSLLMWWNRSVSKSWKRYRGLALAVHVNANPEDFTGRSLSRTTQFRSISAGEK
jgi:uncharacterized iron-regulated membrane protein